MKLQHIARGAPPLLIGLLLLMSSPACRKGPKVDGRVLEYGSDKPIENATVILSECESESSGDVNCFEVGRTTTDSDGSFGFDKEGFTVGAAAPRYWASGDDYQVISGDGKPIDLHLYPYAWLKVVIKNESGAYAFSGPSESGGESLFYLSKDQSEEILLLLKGNTDFKYIFSVVEQEGNPPSLDPQGVNVLGSNGIKIPVEAGLAVLKFNVYCPGQDTTFLTITY